MLIFDFDGVLINSIDEVTLAVYNTATGNRATCLADLPAAVIELFQNNRHHVQPIGDAILLMNWCLGHYRCAPRLILSPREYEILISVAEDAAVDRTRRIYETRQDFIEKDPKGWLALHQPYQPLWDECISRPNYPFVILTHKNRSAALRLCRLFGLNPQTLVVYSGEKGPSKTENMHRILDRYGAGPHHFIDDSLKNLQELDAEFNRQKKRLNPLLASWGYTGPEDEKTARNYGYTVLTQMDAVSLLNRLMPL